MKYEKISHRFPIDRECFDHKTSAGCVAHMLRKDPTGKLVRKVAERAADSHHSWTRDERVAKIMKEISSRASEFKHTHKNTYKATQEACSKYKKHLLQSYDHADLDSRSGYNGPTD